MLLKLSISIICLFVLTSVNVHAESILLLTPLGSKSHKNFFMALAEPLAKRGHNVTIVSSFNPTKKHANIREIIVTNFEISSIISSAFTDEKSVLKNLVFETPRLCSETLSQLPVQNLKNEKFDLVILSLFVTDCYLSLVHHFKVPFIYAFSAPFFGFFSGVVGNIEYPSFAPDHVIAEKFPLHFFDRLKASLFNVFMTSAKNHFYTPRMESVCRAMELCPEDMPPLPELQKNASLAIINQIRPLEFPPRPRFPNIIYAGGAHIKPPKQLPGELEDWISDSGEDGVIFFSLGSAMPPSLLPESYRQILVKVFGSLKQKVLWKWSEETMPNLPKNVKLSKWFPQQDVLGHPKVKLFITQGGMLSTYEALYNGVPLIGMPIFADQNGNMRAAKREGWANTMHWKDLEEDSFRKLIIDTINNKSMYDEVRRRSSLMKDVPIHPAEEATFWVEYVMRHKGAAHLMSPTQSMEWFELYNTDVWAFITGVFLLFVYFSYCLICSVLKVFKSKQTKATKRD